MHRGIASVVFVLFFMLLNFGCSDSAERTMDDKLKNSYFTMCYTSQFANRFSLPAGKAMDLDKGLHAIAIEIRPVSKSYHTFIHLYLDSRLDIYTPGNQCNYYRKPKAEWFFPKQYNDKDIDWNAEFVNKATMRMLYRSRSNGDLSEGVGQSLHFDMFRKAFLPNLSLLSTRVNSSLFDMRYAPGDVLVQKNNVGDYLLEYENITNPEHPENYYVFNIPERLFKAIQPYLEHIDTKIEYADSSLYPIVDYP